MLVTAAIANAVPSDETRREIVFIPEGDSRLTPYVDGKPKSIEVHLTPENGERIAAKFQADLEQRHKENVRPWTDFDHEGRASAGNPTAFRYEKGKGLVVAMDWSEAGKQSIEGKAYSYFSPSFILGENGEPEGLDMRGPVGSLVNEPAFRNIPRIAASDGSAKTNHHPNQPTPNMSEKIYAALGVDPAHEKAESAAIKKIQAMEGESKDNASKLEELNAKIEELTKERDALKESLDDVEAKAKGEREERAKEMVDAALADGRIDKDDEETAKGFREKIEAGDAFAERVLAKLPKPAGPGKEITGGDKSKKVEAKSATDRLADNIEYA